MVSHQSGETEDTTTHFVHVLLVTCSPTLLTREPTGGRVLNAEPRTARAEGVLLCSRGSERTIDCTLRCTALWSDDDECHGVEAISSKGGTHTASSPAVREARHHFTSQYCRVFRMDDPPTDPARFNPGAVYVCMDE